MLCEYVNEKRKRKLTLNMFKFNFKVQHLQANFKSENEKVAKLTLRLDKVRLKIKNPVNLFIKALKA